MGAAKTLSRALGWILPAIGLVVLVVAAVLLLWLLSGGTLPL